MAYYFGVDLGGTNIDAGLVGDDAGIIGKLSARTNAPRSSEAISDDIAALFARLLEDAGLKKTDISWIGIGSPGFIYNDLINFAHNLKLHEAPLAAVLSEKMGIRTFIENDGNCAAYGEWAAGAGKGKSSLVFLTLGTGVGGGIILDGKIHRGFRGAAAELGHIIIRPEGRECVCGRKGCLEAYCSATALKAITREVMERNKDSVMWELCGNDITCVSAKTSFEAQRMGDAGGTAVVNEYILNMSLGIVDLVYILQPEVICIGGGVAREGEEILRPLRELVDKEIIDIQRPEIIASTLSNSGLIGAAFLGKQYE